MGFKTLHNVIPESSSEVSFRANLKFVSLHFHGGCTCYQVLFVSYYYIIVVEDDEQLLGNASAPQKFFWTRDTQFRFSLISLKISRSFNRILNSHVRTQPSMHKFY